jgi:hypothetical protein
MKRLVSCLVFSAIALGITAQERLTREGSFSRRQYNIQSIPANPEKARAVQLANRLGLPTRMVYSNGRIVEIRRLGPGGQPRYLTTLNRIAASTISTNKVWPNGGSGLNLSGEGLVVGVWDGGVLRVTHREFEDRGRIMNPSASEVGHSTHVSGTIGAAGIDSNARGMANQIIIEGYDWDDDLQEMDAAAKEGLLISNHSYGYVLGYDYNVDLDRWYWWGDTEISEEEDYFFGFYHEEARAYDQIAFDNPNYLIVRSAGNDRGEEPSAGTPHYIWMDRDWVLSSVERPMDGGQDEFDCMGPVSSAKNIMAVGSVGDLPDGYSSGATAIISSFSAFGPTDDGRIKPDVVGNGESLYSTYSDSDSDYRNESGTSMSAPNIAGSMALLQEHCYDVYGEYLTAASLKGLVLHTADDVGNPGPDYQFGWGVMNTLRATEVISHTDYEQIQEHTLDNGNEMKIRLLSDGTAPIRATLCWTDPPGNVPAPALDPSDRILVNDLDIRMIREIDHLEFRPFILDPVQPGNPATTGDNNLDNVEQVFIEHPEKGTYEMVIRHKGELEHGSQAFSLILSGLSGEFYASDTSYLTDNNGSFILTSADEYLPDMMAGWLITPDNNVPISLYFDFFETESNQDILKVYDGMDAGAPLIAELSGTLVNGDTVITSSGNHLWCTFSSDGLNQGKGFNAFYCTTSPEGSFVIEGNIHPCEGSSETYVVSGQDGTYYAWESPAGWDIEATGIRIAMAEIGTGNGLIEVFPWNRCGVASESGLSIEPLSSAPELNSFTGDTLLCAGKSGTLRVDELPGSTYDWMLPGDWLGTSETSEITFTPTRYPGQVRVSAFNACASGDTLSISVGVENIPDATTIFSISDQICSHSNHSFYIIPSAGIGYEWSVEPGWSIVGDNQGDTVEVEVGETSGNLYVKASNDCGFRNSIREFITAPAPETPLLMSSQSIYEGYRELEVQNATAYRLIQWYLNNALIDSPHATGPSYIAYVPGIYTVGIENQDGCPLLQDQQDGISISGPNSLFAAYGGKDGSLIVQNTTSTTATVNVYDMTGNLMLIHTIQPGHNEINTDLKGVFIVSVNGLGSLHVSRIFLH